MIKRYNDDNGFTLLELIVVCALLAIMTSILYGVINGIIRGRNAILSENEVLRTTRSIVSRLNKELTSRVAEPLESDSESDSQNDAPANPYAALSPQYMMRRVFVMGENKKNGDVDVDSIRFASDGSAQEFLSASGNRGRVEIAYHLEEDPTDKSDLGESTRYTLVRDEWPAGISDDDVKSSHRVTFPLADNIASLNFRYYKDEKWLDEWGSAGNNGLPEAIEVRIGVIGSNDKTTVVSTSVALSRKSRPLSTFQLGTN